MSGLITLIQKGNGSLILDIMKHTINESTVEEANFDTLLPKLLSGKINYSQNI